MDTTLEQISFHWNYFHTAFRIWTQFLNLFSDRTSFNFGPMEKSETDVWQGKPRATFFLLFLSPHILLQLIHWNPYDCAKIGMGFGRGDTFGGFGEFVT
jgi:hypothetical protein